MTELIKCKSCGHSFRDNPLKHRNREKYCPKCGVPYRKPWFEWRPNLNWLRERLEKREEKRIRKIQSLYERARHSLRTRKGMEPSDSEILWEMQMIFGQDAVGNYEALRRKLRKE